ncbi:MAG: hypothetical protein JHC95_07875 [Solirubrobacteraceae bacterium]|nr:hypothetical protein [Solirubrobacteraceae bacterium]
MFLSPRRASLALAVAAAACASSAPASAAETCNPLSAKTCLAPFPSDIWMANDPSSPTGKRANVQDDLLRPRLLEQMPAQDGITPRGIFGGASGFSAGMGAVFEFTQRQAPVPPDGGDVVTAYDLTAGERVPIHAFLSTHARNPIVVAGKQSNVLRVFPRARWAFGHRIVIAVSTRMGLDEPAIAQRAARVGSGGAAAAYVDDVRAGLQAAGLEEAGVRTATLFTVRDRAEVVDATQRLMDDTSSRPHETRFVRLHREFATPWAAGIVTGQVRVDNYRTREGRGPVDFSGKTRKDQWLPFQLTLPRSARTRPAPVVIYAHGITAQKETDLAVSQMNAELGLATISIDWPNHGARARADGGYILSLLSPHKMGTLSGLFNQATIDLTGLYRAIQTLELDVIRDGRPDLDTSSISMQGTSLGGVLGANFAALSPKLDFVDFHVAGLGISNVIAQTALWNGFGFIMPRGRTGTEDAVLQAAVQQALDPSDGVNTLDYVRHPRPGQSRKPMFLLLGNADSLMPNASSVAMANLADLPLIGPELFPMPGIRKTADFDPDGYGVRQLPLPIGRLPIAELGEATGHFVFLTPAAIEQQMRFLRRFGPRP